MTGKSETMIQHISMVKMFIQGVVNFCEDDEVENNALVLV